MWRQWWSAHPKHDVTIMLSIKSSPRIKTSRVLPKCLSPSHLRSYRKRGKQTAGERLSKALRVHRRRYAEATLCRERTEILNEFCEVSGYHPKYAIALLRRPHEDEHAPPPVSGSHPVQCRAERIRRFQDMPPLMDVRRKGHRKPEEISTADRGFCRHEVQGRNLVEYARLCVEMLPEVAM